MIFAALAWAGVSIGFSTYLSNFNSYNQANHLKFRRQKKSLKYNL